MVQPLKPVTASPLYSNSPANFGNKKTDSHPSFAQQKPSKAASFAKFAATEMVAGAAVSFVLDGLTNAWRKFIAKAPKNPLIPLKSMPSRALFMGAMFLLIGTVFSGVGAMMNRNK